MSTKPKTEEKTLKRFTLYGTLHVGVFTDVVAETVEKAIEIAEGRSIQGLCHQCAGSGRSYGYPEREEWRTGGSINDGVVEENSIKPNEAISTEVGDDTEADEE